MDIDPRIKQIANHIRRNIGKTAGIDSDEMGSDVPPAGHKHRIGDDKKNTGMG